MWPKSSSVEGKGRGFEMWKFLRLAAKFLEDSEALNNFYWFTFYMELYRFLCGFNCHMLIVVPLNV